VTRQGSVSDVHLRALYGLYARVTPLTCLSYNILLITTITHLRTALNKTSSRTCPLYGDNYHDDHKSLSTPSPATMPSPQTHIAQPSPLSPARRMSPLLTSNTLGRDLCLTLDVKTKPYTFVPRTYENDYAPPAPPPPSPVNFPSESWSTACRR
jgi:hypothetical protein